jgi:hypothetical protein
MFAIVVVLIITSLLLVATPAHGAGRPRACVGTVVRVIDPGIDVVRRIDGTRCTRPSVMPVRKVRMGR